MATPFDKFFFRNFSDVKTRSKTGKGGKERRHRPSQASHLPSNPPLPPTHTLFLFHVIYFPAAQPLLAFPPSRLVCPSPARLASLQDFSFASMINPSSSRLSLPFHGLSTPLAACHPHPFPSRRRFKFERAHAWHVRLRFGGVSLTARSHKDTSSINVMQLSPFMHAFSDAKRPSSK